MMNKLLKDTSGIVSVYKPIGPTSHDMIDRVRRVTGVKKVGHAGTLDPLAEGVLVIAIGREETKQLNIHVKKEKEYLAEFTLGQTSTTDDEEGEKTLTEVGEGSIPTEQYIESLLPKFTGEIWQTPPIYSAVKIKGKKAYELARKGQMPKMETRKREVKKYEIVEYSWPKLKVRIVTGAGVYIRSLARNLGEELKIGGYMSSLVRTRVGEFGVEDCYQVSG